MNKTKCLATASLLFSLTLGNSNLSHAMECDDRSAMSAAMKASNSLMGGNSFRRPHVLKRHHPSKRKEVATYFVSDDLYYTLFWIVSDDCRADFIKRTQGKY